jgi:hypothetical protein
MRPFLLANLAPRPAAAQPDLDPATALGRPSSAPCSADACARLLATQEARPRCCPSLRCGPSGAGRSPGVFRSPSRPRWSRPDTAKDKDKWPRSELTSFLGGPSPASTDLDGACKGTQIGRFLAVFLGRNETYLDVERECLDESSERAVVIASESSDLSPRLPDL